MKTSTLFTLLLSAAIAFVAGCQTPSVDKSKSVDIKAKIAGSYTGVIFNGGDEYPTTTTFKTEGGKLSGVYKLDVYGTDHEGTLGEFKEAGAGKFKCRWNDDMDREGNFSMTFSPDGSSFKGNWDADDGDGDGEWNGKKK